ncbi:MAG: serine protease [Solirubrobacteraceae bacterium]
MLRSPARRLLLLAALLCLALPATASASFVERHAPPPKPQPRIVNGTVVTDNEKYPAQGRLLFDADPGPGQSVFACGGTLVGSRQFLTAAHCAVDNTETALPPENFNVFLGEVDRNLQGDANRHFFSAVDVHPDYNATTHQNDVAMLTLDTPVTFEPARVVEDGEQDLWAAGTLARVIGWGTTSSGGSSSRFLREADVPIVTDATCSDGASYGADFDPATMVCAGDPPGTMLPRDTCQGDSGGPLYVPDFGSTTADPVFATAGVVSWGIGCANPQFPGIYTRIGEGALNDWTLARTPRASFDLDHAAVATQPVTLLAKTAHPEGPTYFTVFKWDFDQDGQFDDATGKNLSTTFPAAGQRVVGLEASKPGGDVARFYGAFGVASAPPALPPPATTTTPPPPSGGGPLPPPPVVARLATLKSPKTLRARKGRFSIKVSFDAAAPAGKATLTVLLKGKRIGSARVPVKPGGTSTAKVKLTKKGLRKLKRAKKLKVTLRITVGGKAITKALTIKR